MVLYLLAESQASLSRIKGKWCGALQTKANLSKGIFQTSKQYALQTRDNLSKVFVKTRIT